MKQGFLIIFFAIICNGCSPKTSSSGDTNTIIISKNYPQKVITLQSIADVEYIALETTDDILLSGDCRISFISDNYIMIWESNGNIFIFQRNGKIYTHFNHKG